MTRPSSCRGCDHDHRPIALSQRPGGALPSGPFWHAASTIAAPMNVYAQFGLEPIINAAGTSTRVGGPLMHPAAGAGMGGGARGCTPLSRFQSAASDLGAQHTPAEAGPMTARAAGGPAPA